MTIIIIMIIMIIIIVIAMFIILSIHVDSVVHDEVWVVLVAATDRRGTAGKINVGVLFFSFSERLPLVFLSLYLSLSLAIFLLVSNPLFLFIYLLFIFAPRIVLRENVPEEPQRGTPPNRDLPAETSIASVDSRVTSFAWNRYNSSVRAIEKQRGKGKKG